MKRARDPSGFLSGEYPLDEYSISEREHRPCASAKDSLSTGAFRRQSVSKIPARAVNAAVRAGLPKGRAELKAEAGRQASCQNRSRTALARRGAARSGVALLPPAAIARLRRAPSSLRALPFPCTGYLSLARGLRPRLHSFRREKMRLLNLARHTFHGGPSLTLAYSD